MLTVAMKEVYSSPSDRRLGSIFFRPLSSRAFRAAENDITSRNVKVNILGFIIYGAGVLNVGYISAR